MAPAEDNIRTTMRDRFLERFWHDYGLDALLSSEAYKRLFPGIDQLIDEELASHELALSSMVVTLPPIQGDGAESAEPNPRDVASYQVLGCIGRGGMGLVFKVVGLDGQVYALKLPRAGLVFSETTMRRFRREMRLSSLLRHRHLLHAVDGGVYEGRPYLVTDYIAGGSLGELVKTQGRLSVAEATVVLEDILEALSALEAAELIHRDVKPGNILVDVNGNCRLADHGLARSVRPERSLYTRDGDFLGTFAFASPEQLRSEEDLDARTDIFALGVTIASLILGRPPQLGKTLVDVLKKRLEEPVTAQLHHLPGLPPNLLRLLSRFSALARDERPRTARDALGELRTMGFSAQNRDRRSLGARAAALDQSRPAPSPQDAVPWTKELRLAPFSMLLKGVVRVDQRAATQPVPAERGRLVLDLVGPQDHAGHLILHGGNSIVMGGRRPDGQGDIVALPFDAHDPRSRRISARHLQVRIEEGVALVEDLRSKGGSKLDGIPLMPNCAEALGLTSVVELATVFSLQLRVAGAGSHTVVWIEDATAKVSRSHVLVHDTLALGEDLQIQFRRGAFWTVVGDLRRRIRPGDSLSAGAFRARVRDPVNPE